MATNEKPDPMAWFEELVGEYPGAESYRVRVDEVRESVFEAFSNADAQVQHARAFLQEKMRRYLVELVTTAFDKQATYTTAILSIGYVGLFTAWAQTGDEIPIDLARLVVISALASLVVFILFEVFKMIYGHIFLFRTLNTVKAQGADFDPELEEYIKATNRWQTLFYGVWATAIILTLMLGLTSAGVLVYAHLEQIYFRN